MDTGQPVTATRTPSGDSPSPDDLAPDDLALVGLARLVLAHRRAILSSGALALVLVVGFTLLQRRSYTSSAVFMPQASESPLARLSGLAAQFGFAVPGNEGSPPPAFYADLLESRGVLQRAVLTPYGPYAVGDGGDTVQRTLIDIYQVRGRTAGERRDAAVRRLRDDLRITVARETDLITLEVTTRSAALSQQVAARMVQLVGEFNLKTRQTRAGAERQFVEARLQDARSELKAAEDRLQVFLQRNRDFRSAPQLAFQYDRLQRDVTMRQELYTSLAQSFEQARIEEVRNTPVITIVEPANLPTSPDRRRTVLKGLLGLIAGLLIGTFAVALRHAFRDLRSPDSASAGPTSTLSASEAAAEWPRPARERESARS
jgi:uncharacterized protein involved in exopolysaccharide biosynthesis